MRRSVTRRVVLWLLVAACVQGVAAQTQPASRDDDEVIRVNAELVQTNVTVLDKRGRYVIQISAAAAQSKLAATQQANFILE